jgi:hypothetical protein
MGRVGKKSEGRAKTVDKADDRSKKPSPPSSAADDDSYEDGDIATPKFDREGDDDEPL